MSRCLKFVVFVSSAVIICSGVTHSQAAQGQAAQTLVVKPLDVKGKDIPLGYKENNVSLFFRETWKIPPVEHDGGFAQRHVSNSNLQLKLYGSATDIDAARGPEKGMQANGGPGLPGTGHVFTGLCERPCAMALSDKNNYVDLSSFGKIRWSTRVTGLHELHPIVRLADGTWLLGEHGDGSVFDYHVNEFTLSETRWIQMDMEKVVTRGRWVEKVDLTKVDAIGFADLMPGSGHGDGGYSNLDFFEVYGKAVPRSGTAPAQTK
jgi:hypothetical protein